MTNQEILEKAITEAIDGGWNPFPGFLVRLENVYEGGTYRWITFGTDTDDDHDTYNRTNLAVETVIFNPDFAHALWGEKTIKVWFDEEPNFRITFPAYIWHLQQMVTAEDRIKYLGENI